VNGREQALRAWLASAGRQGARLEPLAGDASGRRYFRLASTRARKGAVLMDARVSAPEQLCRFARISNHLRALDLSAPAIFVCDPEAGFMLLEDLGDGVFSRVLENEPSQEQALYARAVDVIAKIQSAPAPEELSEYSPTVMADAIAPVFDWYLVGTGISKQDLKSVCQAEIRAALDNCSAGNPVLSLRDFHAGNLMWLPERKRLSAVGLLDFQDAVICHPAYDLVSLLEDARRDVGEETRRQAVRRFAEHSGLSEASLSADLHVLGAQRNLRILGVFARLCLEQGRDGYIDLLPRVWANLVRDLSHPRLFGLRSVLADTLPKPTAAMLKRLRSICAEHLVL